jgi:hypothetical protein
MSKAIEIVCLTGLPRVKNVRLPFRLNARRHDSRIPEEPRGSSAGHGTPAQVNGMTLKHA